MNNFRVTPIQVGRLILEPIKFFFHKNAPDIFRWDADAKVTKIDISMVNDAHKENLDDIPQILVSRGGFQVNKTGLSDNMAEQKPVSETQGRYEKMNFLMYQGQASIVVKSRNEGTTEIITDMVMHVLQWSRPHICDTLGFKEFGLPMFVSDTSLRKEHIEVFETQITVPYILEEGWMASNEALLLRDFFLKMSGNAG